MWYTTHTNLTTAYVFGKTVYLYYRRPKDVLNKLLPSKVLKFNRSIILKCDRFRHTFKSTSFIVSACRTTSQSSTKYFSSTMYICCNLSEALLYLLTKLKFYKTLVQNNKMYLISWAIRISSLFICLIFLMQKSVNLVMNLHGYITE